MEEVGKDYLGLTGFGREAIVYRRTKAFLAEVRIKLVFGQHFFLSFVFNQNIFILFHKYAIFS